MRKMKDSGIEWIGEIPENWGCSKAKYYIQINNGFDPKTEGDIPVYGSGSGCFKSCGESKDGPAVLLGRKGTVDIPRYIEGKYWNVDTAFDVKTDETSLLLKYYFYLSTCFDYRFYTATTTLPSMTQTSYENMFIPVPDIDIQHKIVAYIESKCKELDMIIAAKEKTNELLKERRQSIIYEAVTKGLDPTVPMKDSGIEWIGEIPESWEVKKIKHIGNYRNGLTYSPNDIAEVTDGTLVLRSSNIQNGRLVFDDNVFVSCNIPEQLKVHKGDILICSRNGSRELIGKNAIIDVDDDLSFGAFMMIFRCHTPKYMSYILNSNIFTYYLSTFLTATVNQLTGENFGNMKIVYCSDEQEQKNLVEFLDKKCKEIDILVSSNNSTIEKLKEYRQSVIYEAVTGKVEI